jgi:hypothetical protein
MGRGIGEEMKQLLLGATSMASLTISLFFLRFWNRTGDRFFLFFSLSFLLEGLNRTLMGSVTAWSEVEPVVYLVRLLSFLLILVAIIDKNRKGA